MTQQGGTQGQVRPRVLLVDDHPDTAELLAMFLQRRGFEVSTAGSVQGAVELFDGGGFEVLVSDLRLPDGSGVDLLKRLRKQAAIPAVALSGASQPEDLEATKQAGFNVHLIKPVSAEHLVQTLRNLLPASSI